MPRPVIRAVARPATRFFVVLTVLSLLTTPVAASPDARPNPASDDGGDAAPIQQGLLDDLRSGELDRFVVEFTAQANLAGAGLIDDFARRGRFVMNRLMRATASQDAAIALVEATPGAHAESFWLRNTLVVYGGAGLATEIAKLPGVTAVRAEKIYPLVKPVETKAAVLAVATPSGASRRSAPTRPGPTASSARASSSRTSTRASTSRTRPSSNQYRGNNGDGTFDHDYNWWDPTGICGGEPCDNVGHGTHTMGTMVGGDGPGPFTPDIGVAPGAQLDRGQGLRGLRLHRGRAAVVRPVHPRPDRPRRRTTPTRPSARTSSTTRGAAGPATRSTSTTVTGLARGRDHPRLLGRQRRPVLRRAAARRATSSSPSASARPTSTTTSPTSRAAARRSSARSTPTFGAPGVDVVSSVPGGGYDAFSGTSMAAPAHVRHDRPDAVRGARACVGDFEQRVRDRPRSTAVDRLDDQCGGDEDGDPNNVYGDGRIDAKAAVDLVATGGTLAGTVTDADTRRPDRRRHGDRQRRRAATFTASPTATATTSCSSPRARTPSAATAFGYAADRRVRAS